MLRKICFFNFFHNGDIFTGKAFVQLIMRTYPGVDYSYALGSSKEACDVPRFKAAAGTNPFVINDLRCRTLPCDALPESIGWFDRFAVSGDQIFVNTWVGAYSQDVFMDGEEHANYPSLQRMWRIIFDELNSLLGLHLKLSGNLREAIPSTDWSVYDTAAAEQFVLGTPSMKRLLFSNGPVQSRQSAWGDCNMREVVEALAAEHGDWCLICTREFSTDLPNIFFTRDIFNQQCDINEIAFLSTQCDFIWGKVSGPYMYCHVHENLLNPKKVFMSSSDRPSDSLPYGCNGLRCHYYHSLSTDAGVLVEQVENAIVESEHHAPDGSMIVLH